MALLLETVKKGCWPFLSILQPAAARQPTPENEVIGCGGKYSWGALNVRLLRTFRTFEG